MAKRKASKAVTIGGLAAVAAVVVVMILLFAADRRNSDAARSMDGIALDAISLTKEYQEEEGKWDQGFANLRHCSRILVNDLSIEG